MDAKNSFMIITNYLTPESDVLEFLSDKIKELRTQESISGADITRLANNCYQEMKEYEGLLGKNPLERFYKNLLKLNLELGNNIMISNETLQYLPKKVAEINKENAKESLETIIKNTHIKTIQKQIREALNQKTDYLPSIEKVRNLVYKTLGSNSDSISEGLYDGGMMVFFTTELSKGYSGARKEEIKKKVTELVMQVKNEAWSD